MILQDLSTSERVARCAQARIDSLCNGNIIELDGLLHNDLVHIHTSGRFDNKRSFIESVATKDVIYKGFRPSDIRFVEAGETCIRTGFMDISVVVKGQPKRLDAAFLEVWTKADGKWQLIAWQSTPRANPAR